jgi:CBS domain-containing protein
VETALEQILNLLLESERAGVAALDRLIGEVENDDLRRLLATSREDEAATASALEQLIRANGGQPSDQIGPFAAKVAAAGALANQLRLLIRGEEWVARKVEEALAIAPPDGPIADQLRKMANRHRFEVEWGRAELIRIMNTL